MKTVKIENVCVNAEGGWSAKMRFSLHWEQPGCRYHVWCDADHIPAEEFYMRPPADVERGVAAHFETRRRRTDAESNKAMIAAAFKAANDGGMWQAAIDAHNAKELANSVAAIRGIISATRRAAGSVLLDALKLMVPEYERMNRSCGVDSDDLFLKTARAAIKAAEPDADSVASWRNQYGDAAVDAALAAEEV